MIDVQKVKARESVAVARALTLVENADPETLAAVLGD